jgi:Dyp-type peroxidase family
MPPELKGLLDNQDPILARRTPAASAHTDANKAAYTALFKDLQCNILTPHGFEQAHYFFLRFKGAKEGAIVHTKYLLGMLARDGFGRLMVRNALADPAARQAMSPELIEAARCWGAGAPGNVSEEVHRMLSDLRVVSEYEVYVQRRLNGDAPGATARRASEPPPPVPKYRCPANVLLTRSGFRKLGLQLPSNGAFRAGMAARQDVLEDPPTASWEQGFDSEIDALLIVSHPVESTDSARRLGAASIRQMLDAFRQIVEAHATIVREEVGTVLTGKDAQGRPHPIEPFGYRDGLSQPAFYESDRVYQEDNGLSGAKWDSFAPLRLVLTPDPNGRTRTACGTYFVLRKLEQDIEAFYRQAASLADRGQKEAPPGSRSLTEEAIRARFVGRELDGSLVGQPGAATNDLDFSDDVRGVSCPFHAHIRKMNPRAGMRADWGPKERRIVRRGIPYGPRIERDDSGAPLKGRVRYLEGEEAGPIGLLFLCAQSDIENQFEFLQASWANKSDHPRGRPWGRDTIIGQGGTNHVALDAEHPAVTTDVDPVVTLRGGDYFFAPSIGCLRGLLDDLLVGDP